MIAPIRPVAARRATFPASGEAFVVKTHIAAHDRHLQRAAGVREAGDRLLELPIHLGPVGVGEVEAIGDRERARPGRDDVAGRLGDRMLGAYVGVEMAVASVAVGGHRQSKARALDAQQRGVAAWRYDCGVADHVVVAPEDRTPAAQVGARQQTQQRLAGVDERRQGVEMQRGRWLRRHACETAERSAVGEQVDGQPRHHLGLVEDGQMPVVGNVADHRRGEIPGLKNALHLGLAAALDDDEHPLLRLRQHHVIRRHASLPPRDERDVDARARSGHAARALRD